MTVTDEKSDAERAADLAFVEKLRTLSFSARPTTSKRIVDHTDTAIVTTTEKAESQDVHVAMREPVRPHRPEMTAAHHRKQGARS